MHANTRGLLVVGVGRSGTSIATQMCIHLGLRGPADLMPAAPDNPNGFFESTALTSFNDSLIQRWGSTFWTPPDAITEQMWSQLDGATDAARELFAATYGGADGWVWKDPRNTMLLPFWERVLGVNPVLMPIRSPIEIASSIAKLDGVTLEQGLAIWERHTRLLLTALRGRSVLVLAYRDLVGDAGAWAEQVGAFCEESGLAVSPSEFRLPELLPARSVPASVDLSSTQSELWDLLTSLRGAHRSLRIPSLGQEGADVASLLANEAMPWHGSARAEVMRLEMAALREECDRIRAENIQLRENFDHMHADNIELRKSCDRFNAHDLELQSQVTRVERQLGETRMSYEQQLAAVYASTSWKVTAPLRAMSRLARRGLYPANLNQTRAGKPRQQ